MFEKDGLYSKRGRWERFKNSAQRNVWLKKEIESLHAQVDSQNEKIMTLSQDIARSRKMSSNLSAEMSRVKDNIDRTRSDFENISQQCEDARLIRNKLDEKRK